MNFKLIHVKHSEYSARHERILSVSYHIFDTVLSYGEHRNKYQMTITGTFIT